jgi:ubiquinone/menaquinone biosynthesis C-methylase UbiE
MDRMTQRYYDAESLHYDNVRWESVYGKARDEWQYNVLIHLLGNITYDTLLEIGCGTGRMTLRLPPLCRQLIGIDFSSKMLECLTNKNSGYENLKLCLILADACSLPIPNEVIDAVFFVNTLQLIESPRIFLNEIQRVIKPNGRLIFNYPNLQSVYFLYGFYRNWLGKTRTRNKAGYRRTRWFSKYWLKKILREEGFRVVSILGQPGFNPNPEKLSGWPQFFCPSLFLKAVKMSTTEINGSGYTT